MTSHRDTCLRGRRQDSHSATNRNPGPNTPISEDPCETDSGVAYALVGREATPRLRSLSRWRSLSRVEGGMLVIAVVGLLLN
jgi:hypothetical protein